MQNETLLLNRSLLSLSSQAPDPSGLAGGQTATTTSDGQTLPARRRRFWQNIARLVLGLCLLSNLETAYACTPAPPNLVSRWRAEGNANDETGTNNGTLLN